MSACRSSGVVVVEAGWGRMHQGIESSPNMEKGATDIHRAGGTPRTTGDPRTGGSLEASAAHRMFLHEVTAGSSAFRAGSSCCSYSLRPPVGK